MNAGPVGAVHFVVPEGIDDPARVSGGNVFDQRLSTGLSASGWDVRRSEVEVGSEEGMCSALASVPDGSLVLIDGLVAYRAVEAIEQSAARLRTVILAHMVSASFPGADPRLSEDERRVLRAARLVIVTSSWTRSELIRLQLTSAERTVIATPGAEGVATATGTPSGGALLCVGVVAAHKGQDILIEALAGLTARSTWRCTIVGSLAADPVFSEHVTTRAAQLGIAERVTMAGVLAGSALDAAYRAADLLVAPSRVESYGMAVADGLRRGIPVVASRVGGIPFTVAPGRSSVLVPPEPRALSRALDRWMTDPALRRRLKTEAVRGSSSLPGWGDTVDLVAATLAGLR